jgi:hypothetical protein
MAPEAGVPDIGELPAWRTGLVLLFLFACASLWTLGLGRLKARLRKERKAGLLHVLRALEEELLTLGVISLLLVVVDTYLVQICVKCSGDGCSWECEQPSEGVLPADDCERLVAKCPPGEEPLWSLTALHQAHILLFCIAAVHILYTALSLVLCLWRVGRWRALEEAARARRWPRLAGRFLPRPAERAAVHALKCFVLVWTQSVNEELYVGLRRLFVERFDLDFDFDFHAFLVGVYRSCARLVCVICVNLFESWVGAAPVSLLALCGSSISFAAHALHPPAPPQIETTEEVYALVLGVPQLVFGLALVWVTLPSAWYAQVWVVGGAALASVAMATKMQDVMLKLSEDAYIKYGASGAHAAARRVAGGALGGLSRGLGGGLGVPGGGGAAAPLEEEDLEAGRRAAAAAAAAAAHPPRALHRWRWRAPAAAWARRPRWLGGAGASAPPVRRSRHLPAAGRALRRSKSFSARYRGLDAADLFPFGRPALFARAIQLIYFINSISLASMFFALWQDVDFGVTALGDVGLVAGVAAIDAAVMVFLSSQLVPVYALTTAVGSHTPESIVALALARGVRPDQAAWLAEGLEALSGGRRGPGSFGGGAAAVVEGEVVAAAPAPAGPLARVSAGVGAFAAAAGRPNLSRASAPLPARPAAAEDAAGGALSVNRLIGAMYAKRLRRLSAQGGGAAGGGAAFGSTGDLAGGEFGGAGGGDLGGGGGAYDYAATMPALGGRRLSTVASGVEARPSLAELGARMSAAWREQQAGEHAAAAAAARPAAVAEEAAPPPPPPRELPPPGAPPPPP